LHGGYYRIQLETQEAGKAHAWKSRSLEKQEAGKQEAGSAGE